MKLVAVQSVITFTILSLISHSYAHSQCFTSQGTVSLENVPTETDTHTLTVEKIKTRHSDIIITETQSARTKTKTVYASSVTTTTLPQKVDTFTTTIVSTETFILTGSTEIDSTTSVVTETSTEYFTATISTPGGFTPIQSSLPGYESKKKRSMRIDRRGMHNPSDPPSPPVVEDTSGSCPGPQRHPSPPKHLYPEKVYCIEVVLSKEKSTTTVMKTKTSMIKPPNPTITSTSLILSTSTVCVHPANSTVTTTSTATITSIFYPNTTTTFLSTTTTTTSLPTATFYAACSSSNIAGAVNGNGLRGWGMNQTSDPYTYMTTSATSAYDCCVGSMLYDSSYFWYYTPSSSLCQFFTISTCPVPGPNAVQAYFYVEPDPIPADQGGFGGNGACGQVGANPYGE